MSLMGDDPTGMFSSPTTGSQYRLDNIYQVAPSFLGDLQAYFELNPFKVPIDQVTGFTQIVPYVAPRIGAQESKGGTAYGALTTPGPLLTGLPDGTYFVIWGFVGTANDLTGRAKMAISVNGGAADDANHAFVAHNGGAAGPRFGTLSFTTYTLNAGSGGNSLTALYAVGNATMTGWWGGRVLAAIRISGP